MENTKPDRLIAALGHSYNKKEAWAKERERNRKKNVRFKESIRASMKRRMEKPKNIASARMQARLVWLLRHSLFAKGKYPPMGKIEAPRFDYTLGVEADVFRSHLEALFKDGMTWANYGILWQIGHRVPVRLFDCADPEQFKLCFHYKNLQPEIRGENMRRLNEKGNLTAANPP